jgi:hypothetical protein
MRGRLISAATYLVEIAQLDAQLSEQSQPGMDPVFREPFLRVNPNTNQRETGRKERTVRLHAQVEAGTYGQLVVSPTGILPKTGLTLVFHYEELEERGMVDDQRRNTPIRVTDRLVAIYNPEDECLLQSFPYPPGTFCTQARPEGYQGGRVNLLVTEWSDRPQGKTA